MREYFKINGVTLLEPNVFDVADNANFSTMDNVLGDTIVVNKKGSNYGKVTITITWNRIEQAYIDTIKDALFLATPATVIHGLVNGTQVGRTDALTYDYLKVRRFSPSISDDLRSRTDKGEYYYNLTVELEQTISRAIGG